MLVVFAGYAGVSFYFNYFFHDFNRSTTVQFYALQKRSVFIPEVTSLLREAVRTGNMIYLQRNMRAFFPPPLESSVMRFLQDIIDAMFNIEAIMRNYKKTGNADIFPRYFELTRKLDSSQFCAIVDTLPGRQLGRIVLPVTAQPARWSIKVHNKA